MPASADIYPMAVCVDPEKIDLVWPRVRGMIKEAYDRQPADDGFEATEKKVVAGNALVWLAWDGEHVLGACITEIWQTPTRKICGLLATAGKDVNKWRHLLTAIEKYAKDENCDCVRGSGRRGWARILKDYTQPWITLEKKI